MNDLQNAFIYIKPKQPEPVARVFGRPFLPWRDCFERCAAPFSVTSSPAGMWMPTAPVRSSSRRVKLTP